MASLQEAEAARRKFSRDLAGIGAHAIEVVALGRGATKDFVLRAHFVSKPKPLPPKLLRFRLRDKDVSVRLIVKQSPVFKLDI